MNSEDGFKRGYNRKKQDTQSMDEEDIDWKHDKFVEKGQPGKAKKGKRNKFYKNSNQNYGRVDRNQKIDFSKEWAHDKFHQFDREFDGRQVDELAPRVDTRRKNSSYQGKKKANGKWKKNAKSFNEEKKWKSGGSKCDKMVATVYNRDGESVEVDFPIIKENEEKEPNLKQNLLNLLADLNLSRLEQLEAMIALISEMAKKTPNGVSRFKGLLNFYIKEHVNHQESIKDKNKIFRKNGN